MGRRSSWIGGLSGTSQVPTGPDPEFETNPNIKIRKGPSSVFFEFENCSNSEFSSFGLLSRLAIAALRARTMGGN